VGYIKVMSGDGIVVLRSLFYRDVLEGSGVVSCRVGVVTYCREM
jgi:hypothetical protein